MLDSLISAGSSLIGGLLGDSSKSKDRKIQKDAMQHGISYRVADAKAAGIHPIYALGAPTFSPSPVSAGGYDMASALGDMGQNISRAASAYSGKPDRAAVALQALALERGELENELLRSQIRAMNAAGTPPGLSRAARAVVSGGDRLYPKGPVAPLAETAPRQTITLGGVDLKVPPGNTWGQGLEELFGDADWLQLPNIVHMIDYNMKPGGALEPSSTRYARAAADWLRSRFKRPRIRTRRGGG